MSELGPLPTLSPYPSAEERWLAAIAQRLDVLLGAVAPLPAPAAPTDPVLLQEPVRRGPGRPRKEG